MLEIRHITDAGVRRLQPEDLADGTSGDGYVWIDLHDPTDDEESILELASLGIEPMAIEDMREDLHLPKLDVFEDQFLLTVHGIAVQQSRIEIETVEVDVLVKRDVLVTFHEDEVASVDRVLKALDRRGNKGLTRPIEALHRILDVMNDVFVPFLDLIERRLDLVEEDILTEPTEMTRREIYELQRDVIQLRRVVVPQAEVLRRLGRDQVGLVEERDMALFRDIYDHLYRMAEFSDSYRQLLDSAMDNYRSALNDDLNDMLKVLTLFSAMLLPISVLAGIYGMNFAQMPELQFRWAYPALWAVFITVLVGEFLWFRSRGWVGGRAEREAMERRRSAFAEVLHIPVLGTVLKVPAYGARAVFATAERASELPRRLTRRLAEEGLSILDPDDEPEVYEGPEGAD